MHPAFYGSSSNLEAFRLELIMYKSNYSTLLSEQFNRNLGCVNVLY